MNNTQLTWADIWMLQTIRMSTTNGNIDFPSFIGIADGINHAIPTSEEFNNAIYRLEENGLLEINEKKLKLSNKAIQLFSKHKNKSTLKQMSAIEDELGALKYNEQYDPNVLVAPKEFISKGNFNNAINQYQAKYGF